MQHPRFTVDGPAARRIRMRQGLELADVAARVGITRAYLSRIELHSRAVRPRTYAALCRALNADHEDLLMKAGPPATKEDDRCSPSPPGLKSPSSSGS